MSLFIDKYRPDTINDLTFNVDKIRELSNITKNSNMSHIIINGPAGSGKLTLALLSLYDYHKKKIIGNTYNIKLKNSSNKNCTSFSVISSCYHHIIDPSIYGIYDRIILQYFINNIICYNHIKKDDNGLPISNIIIIKNSEKLSEESQHSLRRTLETCYKTCKFIFLVNQNCSLIDPIESRCIHINISAPTTDEITTTLKKICLNENIKYKDENINNISTLSNRNIRIAINMLNNICVTDNLLCADSINVYGQYFILNNSIIDILNFVKNNKNIENTEKVIEKVRENLYNCLVNCYSYNDIINCIIKNIDIISSNTTKQINVVKCLIETEKRLKLSTKDIYHLEYFFINII